MTKRNQRAAAVAVAMAERVADRTQDAYSFDKFGDGNWRDCARVLARRGYTEREAEAILRSKWTRWAADLAGADGETRRCTSVDFCRFLDDPKNKCTPAAVAALVAETFMPSEAAALALAEAAEADAEEILDLVAVALAVAGSNGTVSADIVGKARRAIVGLRARKAVR